jgi:proline racemase
MTERPLNPRRSIRTVDSHTEGNPTRVIVGGVPVPPGDSLFDRQRWLARHDDELRRLLCFEPRGGGLMCAVLLMPAVTEDAHFSVLIMEQEAYVPMSGHCIIGAATTVVETGMVAVQEGLTVVKFDTPAGRVVCLVETVEGSAVAVSFDNVDSFLDREGVLLDTRSLGLLSVDIAYGGDYYAIVDADAISLGLTPDNDAAIIRVATEVRRAVAEQLSIQHPEKPEINECYQVMFVSDVVAEGDYKQTIVSPPGAIDRSPCGTGTSARLACLYSRGQIGLGEARNFEGILGTTFEGSVIGEQKRAGRTFVSPRVRGRAWITGYNHLVLASDDPFPGGFQMGPRPLSAQAID